MPPLPSPEPAEIRRAVLQGNCLEVWTKLSWSRCGPGAKRDQISGFTRAARKRLLRLLAKIDWPRVGKSLFVTLTYPDAVVERPYAERTKDRTLFLRWAEKEVKFHFPALWRTEWKARKSGDLVGQVVPHHHFVLLGVPFICQHQLRAWWGRRLAWDGPLATDVQGLTEIGNVASYVAKYAAKQESSSLDNGAYLNISTGRCWGLSRRSMVPMCRQSRQDGLSEQQVYDLGQVVKERLKLPPAASLKTYTVLGEDVRYLAAKYLGLVVDDETGPG